MDKFMSVDIYNCRQTTPLQPPQDIIDNLLGSSLTAQIGRQVLALNQVTVNSLVDLGGGISLAHKLQHQPHTSDGGNRVRNSLAHDIRGRAMARLTNSEVVTDVCGWHQSERSNKGGGTVGENVTVKVGRNNNVEVGGLAEELVDHGVDNLLLTADSRVARVGLVDSADSLTEESVGLGEDVGLVGDGHERGGSAGAAEGGTLERKLESDLSDAAGGAGRDALDCLGDLGAVGGGESALLFDVLGGVSWLARSLTVLGVIYQVLGVLTNNDEIDRDGAALDGLDWADIGVEVQLLAEGHNGGGVALNLGAWGAAESLLVTCSPPLFNVFLMFSLLTLQHRKEHHHTRP